MSTENKRTKIIVSERFHIELDSLNFILYQTVPKDMTSRLAKGSDMVTKIIGYFPTINLALKRALRELTIDNELGDIHISQYIERLEQKLDTINRDINYIVERNKLTLKELNK